MIDCSITPGRNALAAFNERDASRLRNAAIKISMKYKNRRKQLRACQKHVNEKEKDSYISGGFGLTSTPEYKKNCSSKRKKKCDKNISIKKWIVHEEADDNFSSNEPKIQFVLQLTDKFKVFNK